MASIFSLKQWLAISAITAITWIKYWLYPRQKGISRTSHEIALQFCLSMETIRANSIIMLLIRYYYRNKVPPKDFIHFYNFLYSISSKEIFEMHKFGIIGIFILLKLEDKIEIVIDLSEISQWQIYNCIRIYLIINWFCEEVYRHKNLNKNAKNDNFVYF